ncbi:MAG: hypothetical protein KKG99_03130 [Bacteroidetes bacterium]|nr:hypothetical protein [Bacteroidota bacterium]
MKKKIKKLLFLLIAVLMQNMSAFCQTNQTDFPVLKGSYLGQTQLGDKSQVFAPGFVSTEYGELNAVFNSDGTEFYFSRRGIPGTNTMLMVTKLIDNEWTKPEPVNFSGTNDDIDPFITSDGNSMIYCSGKVRHLEGRAFMNHDFWISEREGNKWGEPVLFAKEAISEFEDYFPIVTKNGNLYFNSQRGGQGTNDIFCSKYVNGQYTAAEKLPEPINSPHREFDAFLSQDEKIMIFSSTKPGGFGASDIYISCKKPDNSWSEPTNLGNDINSAASEYGATITPDGNYFFYTSTRNGNEDIFWTSAKNIKEIVRKFEKQEL